MKVRTVRMVFQVACADSTEIERFLSNLVPTVRLMGTQRLLIGDVIVESETEVTA